MQDFKKIEEVLKKDGTLFSKDGEFLRGRCIEKAELADKDLLAILLSDDFTKRMFFREINGTIIFDKDGFESVISQVNLLPDSYTAFKNKVGLTSDKKYISNEINDVVLDFPFKDCLTLFDSKDPNKQRDEAFINERLCADQVSIIKAPKVFGEPTKYSKDGSEKVNSFDIDKDNLFIKGNNLIALYSLLPRYEGQIKLMYWDIMYNTDSDKISYGDHFKHSSWLVMMKNRLEVAKRLLKNDGVICLQCDDKEMAYLKILCDEIFNRENEINNIVVKMSELKGFKMGNLDNKFPKLKEYILIYAKNKNKVVIKPSYSQKQNLDKYIKYYNKRITNIDSPCEEWKIENVDADFDKISHAKEMIYLVTRDSQTKENIPNGQFRKVINKKGIENILFNKNGVIQTALILEDYIKEPVGDIWADISTININKESEAQLENGQKPEKILNRIITSMSNPNDIVLDAYFGTGTTGAVAIKTGRRFIGIEQLDSHIKLTFTRLKEVILGNKPTPLFENWQGGGSFISVKLLENNAKLIKQITESPDDNLDNLYFEIINSPYTVVFDKEIANTSFDDFKKLSPEKKRDFLNTILNKNYLYVNYSDIDDSKYEIDDNTKEFNHSFYGGADHE